MVPARRMNHGWFSDFFNDFFDNNWMVERTSSTAPAVNVLEYDKNYEVQLAAAGMTKDDFNVSLDNEGDLVIMLEKKAEDTEDNNRRGHYLRREFSYSKFRQALLLPEDADRDKINAKVENGVLKVFIPKIEKNVELSAEKNIEIQ